MGIRAFNIQYIAQKTLSIDYQISAMHNVTDSDIDVGQVSLGPNLDFVERHKAFWTVINHGGWSTFDS